VLSSHHPPKPFEFTQCSISNALPSFFGGMKSPWLCHRLFYLQRAGSCVRCRIRLASPVAARARERCPLWSDSACCSFSFVACHVSTWFSWHPRSKLPPCSWHLFGTVDWFVAGGHRKPSWTPPPSLPPVMLTVCCDVQEFALWVRWATQTRKIMVPLFVVRCPLLTAGFFLLNQLVKFRSAHSPFTELMTSLGIGMYNNGKYVSFKVWDITPLNSLICLFKFSHSCLACTLTTFIILILLNNMELWLLIHYCQHNCLPVLMYRGKSVADSWIAQ